MDTQPINDHSPAPIEHPPLTNDRSCLRRGCSWSFGCGLILVAALALAAWFFSNPSAELRATLPQNFPSSIAMYRFDERDGITYLSGARFNRPWNKRLTAVKLAVGKMLTIIHILNPNDLLVSNDQTFAYKDVTFEWLKTFLKKENTGVTDTITIVWDGLDAAPQTISKFYKQNFDAQDFFYVETLNADQTRTITFSKKTIEGKINITPDPKNPNTTPHAELRIHYIP
ncbi:MAG: hypothetical protein UX10_C0003G0016 [Candidatus Magasanikbacteria bacterium GW2011_GWA2_45_39]|uniref:Uncharacterized protein n=2 Tax=Candidatus Magasanikiibacteriota TaxID=1752731 RepID=A0A0G1MZ53_9BACT|nr:MAG: hypothetical protein UX10_C0003G0016 [Candidatus Magasanikbacteria bacterium GW2011_GWA2_45_39]KKU13392.1 MAG: hypothetical protein UX20_C0023G0017 [Candidatus Magasanikbacteria bacterium GW2011_GWC2_45_8]